MELASICDVFGLGGLLVVLQSAVVLFSELDLLHGLEALVKGWLLTLVVLAIDGRASSLGEGLAEQVL